MDKILKSYNNECKKNNNVIYHIKHSVFYFVYILLKSESSSLGMEMFSIIIEMFQLISFSFHLSVYIYNIYKFIYYYSLRILGNKINYMNR